MTDAHKTDEKAEAKFWKALRSDMTVMLASGTADPRPMTAQLDGDEDAGPIWFFAALDGDLAETGNQPTDASFSFVDKGHGTWAYVEGTLVLNNDRAVIDRLWNPFVAAWYEGGKDDPNLALLRFDPADATIWFDANSMVAGIKMLLGIDPKKNYSDKIAEVSLR